MRLLTIWSKYLTENLLPSRSGVELPAEFDIDPKPPYLETVAFSSQMTTVLVVSPSADVTKMSAHDKQGEQSGGRGMENAG
jgi:hypothetical protein